MMDRRGFLKNATLVSAACLMDFRRSFGVRGAKDAEVRKSMERMEKGAVPDSSDLYRGVGIDVLGFSPTVQRCCLIVVIIVRLCREIGDAGASQSQSACRGVNLTLCPESEPSEGLC